MLHVFLHTIEDTLPVLPFLFFAYLFMEYMEHKTGDRMIRWIKRSGRIGPLIGSAAGMLPQCGFSAVAGSLYAGRIITLGTLFAVFLSTSDEMLPIMISEKVPVSTLCLILLTKFLLGLFFGFLVDLIFRKHRHEEEEVCVDALCSHEHCQCEKGILRSALYHTATVFLFVFVVSFLLNLVIHYWGEENLSSLIIAKPILGQMISALIGLIPNCVASVVITQLYINGAISAGSMMSGLLIGAGVGLLVLLRTNPHKKENFKIIVLLYVFSVVSGILLDAFGFGRLLPV